MEKFTKGEWVVYTDLCGFESDKIIIGMKTYNEDPSEYYCCHRIEIDDSRSEEAVANAHLIAAAPEMYNKLKELSKLMDLLDEQTHAQIEMDCVKHEIDGILSKARGE